MTERQADKIIELLTEIRDEIKNVVSECNSIQFQTSYVSNVKNVAEDIWEEVKKLTEQ